MVRTCDHLLFLVITAPLVNTMLSSAFTHSLLLPAITLSYLMDWFDGWIVAESACTFCTLGPFWALVHKLKLPAVALTSKRPYSALQEKKWQDRVPGGMHRWALREWGKYAAPARRERLQRHVLDPQELCAALARAGCVHQSRYQSL